MKCTIFLLLQEVIFSCKAVLSYCNISYLRQVYDIYKSFQGQKMEIISFM